jgi:GTP-binding protein
MALPVVVIVGRPNVGKSALLNLLARQRISIVDPRAGVTRDRVCAIVSHEGCYLEVVDTGGVGLIDDQHLEAHVHEQIRYAIGRADLILFVVDVTTGLLPLDQTVAELLRPLQKPVILVANKVDDVSQEPYAAQFEAVGFGSPLCVSALHGRGRRQLLEQILARLGTVARQPPELPAMKLAIVGKRNAGKSTLVNTLAGEPRMIVSEIPGTTRDAVDVRFERDGRVFVAIDTAGVRRRRSMSDIDFYSYSRALRSIRRADVVLLLIDAAVPVSEVDLKLAEAILDEYKPVILTVNKWDLAEQKATTEQYGDYLARVFPALPFAPISFITATTGANVDQTIELALTLHRQAQMRVSTAELNRVLQAIVASHAPSPPRGAGTVKLYYATQVAACPPTIVFFCNDPGAVRESYRRYLENRLRQYLPFKEVPLRLLFRPRGRTRPQAG